MCMLTNNTSKECCYACGRPNQEYINNVASTVTDYGEVVWYTNIDHTKHVIIYDTGEESGESVFAIHSIAAERYHELVKEID